MDTILMSNILMLDTTSFENTVIFRMNIQSIYDLVSIIPAMYLLKRKKGEWAFLEVRSLSHPVGACMCLIH